MMIKFGSMVVTSLYRHKIYTDFILGVSILKTHKVGILPSTQGTSSVM